ncbi:uncharacterized protein LOC62_04G005858 [Vanrija pseudolonga]|uniref:Uncharacterized protein n=1 Tax=Vanrija pseudolonga TaxID=143232 RepID=A0AAF1BMS7_9TREE|nr:hypothetical protein LOC62_04G005858 [Vanrija pseudolonga]
MRLELTGKGKSTALEPHRADPILTGDHILDVISVVAAHEDTDFDAIKARISEGLIPGLPGPSEPRFTEGGSTTGFHYPDFGAAMRQVISDSLARHHIRGEAAAAKFIRALTGTAYVSETVQCFIVNAGHSRHADGLKKWAFCWPEDQVSNVFDKETVQGFAERQEVYAAAVVFARQLTSTGGNTLAKLSQRLRGKR